MIEHIDIHAVEHCCYHCESCGHFSTYKRPTVRQADEYIDDLKRIRGWVGLAEVCVLGGEPFLHPDLRGFLREIRNAAPWGIRMLTNGSWAIKHPEWAQEFRGYVDRLVVSLHPEFPFSWDDALEMFRGCEVEDKRSGSGWCPLIFTEIDGGDRCSPSHHHPCPWRDCFALNDGVLYRCAVQAYCEETLVGRAFWAARNTDGFQVSTGNQEQFTRWLERHPASCHFCATCSVLAPRTIVSPAIST